MNLKVSLRKSDTKTTPFSPTAGSRPSHCPSDPPFSEERCPCTWRLAWNLRKRLPCEACCWRSRSRRHGSVLMLLKRTRGLTVEGATSTSHARSSRTTRARSRASSGLRPLDLPLCVRHKTADLLFVDKSRDHIPSSRRRFSAALWPGDTPWGRSENAALRGLCSRLLCR